MHISNKKKFSEFTLQELDEWSDPWFDFDYDYCGPTCSCCALPPSPHEDFFRTIAEITADIIVNQQKLNPQARELIIHERMEAYGGWPRRETKINDKIREDIAFIWPHIKDTQAGRDLFSQIFGANDV